MCLFILFYIPNWLKLFNTGRGKQRSIERRIAKSAKNAKRGCTEPLYGKKSKCIIKIVPQDTKCSTFQMDKRCVKRIDKLS